VAITSFSVVVTNWNRGDTLQASVRSILAQEGLENLEILIVDDASDDDSLEVALALRKEHPDVIRVFETHESLTRNINVPANIGFKRARYKYVLLNPSDTIQLLPTNFLEHLRLLRENPNLYTLPHLRHFPSWKATTASLAGSCTLKNHIFRITGYDERMSDWGCDDCDFSYRLRMIGIEQAVCDAHVLHITTKLRGEADSREVNHQNDLIHAENAKTGTYAPNKTWGEHPGLEEMT